MIVDTSKHGGTVGTYASLVPDETSVNKVLRVLDQVKPPFKYDDFSDEAHMTVVYSANDTANLSNFKFPMDDVFALPLKFEFWEGKDKSGYVVLKCISKEAENINRKLQTAGATHSFADYTPHVTIASGFLDEGYDISKIDSWILEANKYLLSAGLLLKFNELHIEDINLSL